MIFDEEIIISQIINVLILNTKRDKRNLKSLQLRIFKLVWILQRKNYESVVDAVSQKIVGGGQDMINRRYEEIQVGDKATFSKTVTEADVYGFAGITGDFNPVHVDAEFAKNSLFKERVAHGILTAGFISAVLGTQLPGINTIYLKQELEFTAPVKIGDTVTAEAEVLSKRDDKKLITLKTTVTNQRGEVVVKGQALVKKVDP
ncbi:hypothetical protein MCACP_14230 [Neomoorella carbonis]